MTFGFECGRALVSMPKQGYTSPDGRYGERCPSGVQSPTIHLYRPNVKRSCFQQIWQRRFQLGVRLTHLHKSNLSNIHVDTLIILEMNINCFIQKAQMGEIWLRSCMTKVYEGVKEVRRF